MGIHFSEERWKQVQKDASAWWDQTLGRSLCKVVVKGAYPVERKKPEAPLLSQATCGDLSYSPEALIDAIDYELSGCAFLGDAFPYVNMAAFGASALAGMCGAEMDNRTGSVWYFPKEEKEIGEIHVKYNPNSLWATRIKDLYRAGQKRWGSQVLFSMPDLGGFQDVAATLVGSDALLCALIEEPEEVQRLQAEVYQAFFEAYKDFASVLEPVNPGYTDWCGLYSQKPSYILQDDFAYMISPAMFREFGLPQIEAAARKLEHCIYHLDGVGNLNHLESILSVEEIGAIQWVYGAGQPTAHGWPEVYERIAKAGKNMEIIGSLAEFEELNDRYKKGLYYHLIVDDVNGSVRRQMEYKDCLSDYHVVAASEKEEVLRVLEKVIR